MNLQHILRNVLLNMKIALTHLYKKYNFYFTNYKNNYKNYKNCIISFFMKNYIYKRFIKLNYYYTFIIIYLLFINLTSRKKHIKCIAHSRRRLLDDNKQIMLRVSIRDIQFMKEKVKI